MKKQKKITKESLKCAGKRSVVGITISSIIFNSCDIGEYNNGKNIYGDIVVSHSKKENLIGISKLNLSDSIRQYADIIQKLFSEITSDYDSATEFCNNPELYVLQHNLVNSNGNIEIILSEKDKKILLSLTDREVQNAIRNHDFKSFISICMKKGYFADVKELLTIDLVGARRFFKSDEDFDKYVGLLRRMNRHSNNTRTIGPDEENFAIGAPVVAVGFAAVEIGAYIHMVVRISQYGAHQNLATLDTENEPVLHLWFNEYNSITNDDKIVLYNLIINERINNAMDIINENFPNIDKDEVYKYITNNFKMYYGYE